MWRPPAAERWWSCRSQADPRGSSRRGDAASPCGRSAPWPRADGPVPPLRSAAAGGAGRRAVSAPDPQRGSSPPDGDGEHLVAAANAQRPAVGGSRHRLVQVGDRADRVSVDGDNDVAFVESEALGDAAGLDLGDDDATLPRIETKLVREGRVQIPD